MSNKPFLLDEWELSKWAYKYCKDKEDDSEVRKYITHSFHSALYCIYVNDIPEIRKYITSEQDLRFYRRNKKGYE